MGIAGPDALTQKNQPKGYELWFAERRESGSRPHQIVAELMGLGVRPVNYMDTANNVFDIAPINKEGVDFIAIYNYGASLQTAYRSDTLTTCLENAYVVPGSQQTRTNAMAIVPYVVINVAGDLDIRASKILLLSQAQLDEVYILTRAGTESD